MLNLIKYSSILLLQFMLYFLHTINRWNCSKDELMLSFISKDFSLHCGILSSKTIHFLVVSFKFGYLLGKIFTLKLTFYSFCGYSCCFCLFWRMLSGSSCWAGACCIMRTSFKSLIHFSPFSVSEL